MKIWRDFLTALLFSGLGIALGLGGCGDGEQGGNLSSEDAFNFYTENCDEIDFMADIVTFSTCVAGCPEGDERCEAVCYNDYYAETWSRGVWCSMAHLTMWLAGDL